MSSTLRRFAQAGFTLVELLIVVIILAILAAIVIPQFSSSTTDAQESALDANLAALRSAIELYKVQHNNSYPGAVAITGSTTCSGTGNAAGSAQGANTAGAWTDQLLLPSDLNGQTCTISDAGHRFGPYLRKGIPADAITAPSSAAVAVTTGTGAPISLASSVTTGGWLVDTKSGQIVVNRGDNDSKANPYYKR